MKKLILACTMAIAVAASGIDLRAQSGYDLFQKALATERADGNLRGAIQLYERIVKDFPRDRTLVARALVRMAECHEKLGSAEARRIYQTVIREYADQSEAATAARSRLVQEPAAMATTKGDRAVWTGPKVDMFGQVSPDGRYVTFVDWAADQNLYVRDLTTGTDRPLTATGPAIGLSQFAEFSTISRDGKQVAYAWYNDKRTYDVRIVPLHGTSVPEPRRVFPGDSEMAGLAPHDWSPDGRMIAVHVQRRDGTGQIGVLNISDGGLRILKSVDWRGPTRLTFSPDGRLLAYDIPVADNDAERTIFVIAVDGSREQAVVTHPSRNVVMGWTRDGRHLLFGSDRTGQPALWAQGIADGPADGAPVLMKRDIGSSFALGLSSTGTLFVYKGRSGNYVQVASLDLAAPAIAPPAAGSFQRFIGGGGRPAWSPDGRYLAYTSCAPGPRAACTIDVAEPDGGGVRPLRVPMSYIGSIQWRPDGRSLFSSGSDLQGRQNMFNIDVATGGLSAIAPRAGAIEQVGPNPNLVYFRDGGRIIERNLATGVDRELFRQRTTGSSISIKVSPDGRHVATVEASGTRQTLLLLPVDGGEPRELLRANAGEEFDGFRLVWTPDGRSVVLPKTVTGDKPRAELWLVPVTTNGAARKLTAPNLENWIIPGGGFAIHPDGTRVAFVGAAGSQGAEVWAIEDALPKQTVR